MGFRRLEEIEVWKRGCRLVVEIYKITNEEKMEKDWGLKDQIRRAAVAIPSNIAEGYERGTPAEFRRFAQIAKGSCGELRTQLYLTQALGYTTKTKSSALVSECVEISAMLNGLMKELSKQVKR